jgi:hypothetical protein
MNLVCEFDDLPLETDRTLDYFTKLRETHPGLKVTMFAIPYLMTAALWNKVDKDWIQVGIHGYRHDKGEMRMIDSYSEAYHIDKLSRIMADTRYQRIIKPPHYGYGRHVLTAAAKLGLAVAIRRREDVYAQFASPEDIPDLKAYVKYDRPDMARWFSHPVQVPRLFNQEVQSQFPPRYEACEGRCVFLMDELDKVAHKVYLGAGTHVIPGFEHLDHIQHTPDIIKWSWGQPIPFPANSCSYILIQQSLMYCDKDRYAEVLLDCRRALMPEGVLLIKEDDNRFRTWREIGFSRGGSTVRSTTNPKELSEIIAAVGFKVADTSFDKLLEEYPGYFNRERRVWTGDCFIVKALAHKPEVKYEY